MMKETDAGRATGKVAFPAEAEAAFQRYLESTVDQDRMVGNEDVTAGVAAAGRHDDVRALGSN